MATAILLLARTAIRGISTAAITFGFNEIPQIQFRHCNEQMQLSEIVAMNHDQFYSCLSNCLAGNAV
jgi:hypothetical protein